MFYNNKYRINKLQIKRSFSISQSKLLSSSSQYKIENNLKLSIY